MSEPFLSCNGLGCSPARMIFSLRNSRPTWPQGFQPGNGSVIFTHQGRYAISVMCRLLGIGPGDEVLVPSYNCGAEIDPYVSLGATAVFYRVDNRANLDEEDVMRRVTPATRLIHVTHFFGWPQRMMNVADWCKKKGLYLLEDCALALFSKGSRDVIGKYGDAAMYSFVKSLAAPDGGALVINNKDLLQNRIRLDVPPRRRDMFIRSLPLLKKWLMHENRLWQRYEFTRRLLTRSWLKKAGDQDYAVEREMPESNYFDREKIDWTISQLSRELVCSADPGRIAETRRRNYLHLHDTLRNVTSVQFLFDDLPAGVCPLSFPVFVTDRSRWCRALEDRGILVGGWPSYHRDFDWKEFPEARHLKNNLLTLPVHQDLDEEHMEHITRCVKSIAADHGNHHSR